MKRVEDDKPPAGGGDAARAEKNGNAARAEKNGNAAHAEKN